MKSTIRAELSVYRTSICGSELGELLAIGRLNERFDSGLGSGVAAMFGLVDSSCISCTGQTMISTMTERSDRACGKEVARAGQMVESGWRATTKQLSERF